MKIRLPEPKRSVQEYREQAEYLLGLTLGIVSALIVTLVDPSAAPGLAVCAVVYGSWYGWTLRQRRRAEQVANARQNLDKAVSW